MTPIEIKITLDISERMEAIAKTLLQQVDKSTVVSHVQKTTQEIQTFNIPAEPSPATTAPEETTKIEYHKEEKVENPASNPAAPTAEDVRRAMDEVRDKYEFGDVPEGETKGTNPTADKATHKMLTAAFKMVANNLEEGKKPSELKPENRQEFIDTINQLTPTPNGFEILPF